MKNKFKLNTNPDHVEIGPGGVKGTVGSLKKIAPWALGGLLIGWGINALYERITNKCETKDDIHKHHEASKDRINENHEKADDKIKVGHAATDDKIRFEEVKGEIKLDILKAKGEAKVSTVKEIQKVKERFRRRMHGNKFTQQHEKKSNEEWLADFRKTHTMPDFSRFHILSNLLSQCPAGFEDATLFYALSAIGSLCCSKARAQYNNSMRSPSIQVIIEGAHGQGKSYFKNLHHTLFERKIVSDNKKLQDSNDQFIIQTAGINISQARFYDVMAYNKGVHIFAFESELRAVEMAFKKQNGLSFDYIRKAFDNEPVYHDNKNSRGRYPVFLNYTFTGTPELVRSFLDYKEVEEGTASRICFTFIPENKKVIPAPMIYPCGSELTSLQDEIDALSTKYCYTQDSSGKDIPCKETEIELSYIEDALLDWLGDQFIMYSKDNNTSRNRNRFRIATIAFQCAIVLHILAGCPNRDNTDARKAVTAMALYIANYCMEHYLYMFGDIENPQQQKPPKRHLTQDELQHWYPLHGTYDEHGNKIGYGTIAAICGTDKDTARYDINKYRDNLEKARP